MSKKWHEFKEQTSLTGIRIIIFLYRIFGRKGLKLVLFPIAFFYWISNARLRNVSLYWLKACKGQAKLIDSIRHIERFAETIFDKLIVDASSSLVSLTVKGEEIFNADNENQGSVILTSHTGCQELLSRCSVKHTEHRIIVLQHTAHAKKFNELLSKLNPAPNNVTFMEVSSITPAFAMQLSDLIATGAYIIIAGDRTPINSNDFAQVNFFGRPANFPTGGVFLSLILKCPLRAMICTRDPKNQSNYLVTFHSIDENPTANRANRKEWTLSRTKIWVEILENRIATSPLDWFNFFDFWKVK